MTNCLAKCLICDCNDLEPITFSGIETGWHRCRLCGSDTNLGTISEDYEGYESHRIPVDLESTMRTNFAIVELFAGTRRTFLDVGCCEGAALGYFTRSGWKCVGFDVTQQGTFAPVIHAAEFEASLVEPMDVVWCREVIEHVREPQRLFGELVRATRPQGLLHVQTPRPLLADSKLSYQTWHRAIIAPRELEAWANSCGLLLLDRLLYEFGQCWTWQKTY